MITQCPNCATHFRVTADQLKAAAGKVRCSHCQDVFDALSNLRDMPNDPAPTPLSDTGETDISDVEAVESISPNPETLTSEGDASEIVMETPTYDTPAPQAAKPYVPAALVDDLEALERSRRGLFKTLLWLLAILILIAGLATQAAFFRHDRLALNPTLKPWIDRFCDLAACEVATPSDRNAIIVTQRDVRRHPDFANALLIGLTVENQAPFEQAYPVLRVNFTDVGGNPVARRYFYPFEYLNLQLGDGELMPVQTPVLIKLEVADPGDQAISYQFDFF